MSLRLPTENEIEVSLGCSRILALRQVRHSGMFLAGIQAECGIRTGPPTKAFGGDGFEAFYFNRAYFPRRRESIL